MSSPAAGQQDISFGYCCAHRFAKGPKAKAVHAYLEYVYSIYTLYLEPPEN